jgi:hypothetical protein
MTAIGLQPLARRAKHLTPNFRAISASTTPAKAAKSAKTTCAQNRISPAISARDTVSSPPLQNIPLPFGLPAAHFDAVHSTKGA